MIHECKVLIIGMGPSGMMLANELQKHGVNYLIADKRKAISEITRAVNVTPASLAILNFSLGKTLTEKITKTNFINAYWNGKPISKISYKHQRFPNRQFCYLPQPILEKELYKSLQCQKEKIFEETELTSIEKSNKNYIVKLRASDNNEITVKCDYLIGGDGNNSFVRHWANIPSEQEDYNSSFLLYDVKTNDVLTDDSTYHLFNGGYVIIVPIAHKRYRIIVSSQELTDTNRTNYNNIPSLALLLKQYCRLEANIKNIVWFTFSEFRHRISQSISKENCFLIGDAAHIFSPVGGLNLNTGLQDAVNLGWKLAFVIKGYANKKLLDTYAIERQQAIQSIKEKTQHLTKVMTQAQHYAPAQHYISTWKNRQHLKQTLPKILSGYDNYTGTTSDDTETCFKTGHHISEFITDSAKYLTLCQCINSTKFNLLTTNNPTFSGIDSALLNHMDISIPELKDNYILLRPDGYIYIIGKISTIANTSDLLKPLTGKANHAQ